MIDPDNPQSDKLQRRQNKKQNRAYKIHNKGMANWYGNIIKKGKPNEDNSI